MTVCFLFIFFKLFFAIPAADFQVIIYNGQYVIIIGFARVLMKL